MASQKARVATALAIILMLFFSPFMIPNQTIVEAQTFSHGGTLRLALANTIDNFNQFLTNSFEAYYFLQELYPDYRVPLASGLYPVAIQNVSSNANATVWYFTVKPGMHWSDGVPANATDLAYSLRLDLSSFTWGGGGESRLASYLKDNVNDSVKIDNASVVEIDLNKPYGYFGSWFAESTPGFTPYHIWKNFINNSAPPPRNFGTLAGVGPFYISDYHQGDSQITLLPNGYGGPWGGDSHGVPYLDKVVVTLVTSSSQYALLLRAGQVDAAPLAPPDVAGFLNNPNIQIDVSPGTGLWYMEFPLDHYPFNMTAFRQALDYAIDKNALVSASFAGYATPGDAAFIPPTSAEYNSSIPQYAYNVTQARTLLQSLGFKNGTDGYYTLPNGTAFQPTLYVPAENTQIVSAGALVVRYLQAAGINAQVRTIASSSLSSVWYQGTNMYFENTNFGVPNIIYLSEYDFYSYLIGAGPTQGHAFVDPTVSQAYNSTLAQLVTAGSDSQRIQLEQRLEGIIAQYLPSIPLFFPSFIWAFNKATFAGWPTSPSAFEFPGAVWNMSTLASLHLANQSTTIAPSSTSTSATTTPSSSSFTSSSASASAGGSATNYGLTIATVVVIILVAIAAGIMLRRRR